MLMHYVLECSRRPEFVEGGFGETGVSKVFFFCLLNYILILLYGEISLESMHWPKPLWFTNLTS